MAKFWMYFEVRGLEYANGLNVGFEREREESRKMPRFLPSVTLEGWKFHLLR